MKLPGVWVFFLLSPHQALPCSQLDAPGCSSGQPHVAQGWAVAQPGLLSCQAQGQLLCWWKSVWTELEARAGPNFPSRSVFKLHCTSSLCVILTQGCHHTWLLAWEAAAPTCQSHTCFLALCPLQSSQVCYTLSATGSFVRLTADLYTHIFWSPGSAWKHCVSYWCKVSRVMLVRRSWLPLTLGSSSSDFAGTNNHPGYFNKGNSQSYTLNSSPFLARSQTEGFVRWITIQSNCCFDAGLKMSSDQGMNLSSGSSIQPHSLCAWARAEAPFPLLRGEQGTEPSDLWAGTAFSNAQPAWHRA